MSKSLLFIPDISGYTKFIQSTEIEHAEHVIAEILEILIAANTQDLQLAEIEGDALFFYKEGSVPSKEKLLAQIEIMFTAFHGHLEMLKKNRICTCNACATAPELQLKIVAHVGEIQFIKVQGSRKPFGSSVIEAHRLLKNSIESDNYVVMSKELTSGTNLTADYESNLYHFKDGADEYDGKQLHYLYSEINTKELNLKPFAEPKHVNFERPPNVVLESTIDSSANYLLESITNYKYRGRWVDGVDSFGFNENEVTRLGTEHTCVIGGKELNFITVTKVAKANQIIYGELTLSPPPVDELYNFFIIEKIDDNKSKLRVEIYWKAKSPIKKLLIALVVKKAIQKNTKKSLGKLKKFVEARR